MSPEDITPANHKNRKFVMTRQEALLTPAFPRGPDKTYLLPIQFLFGFI
jgi:hypothetical protein